MEDISPVLSVLIFGFLFEVHVFEGFEKLGLILFCGKIDLSFLKYAVSEKVLILPIGDGLTALIRIFMIILTIIFPNTLLVYVYFFG